MAHSQSLSLEIVTPKGAVLSRQVDEVIARSIHGEFGVLPGHLPMLASLDIGMLHYREGETTTDVAVGTGFVEVLADRTLVLTDRFAAKDDIDVLAVRERLKEVDDKLEAWQGDPEATERLQLIEEEQWLAAMLEVIGDPPPTRVLSNKRSVDYRDILPRSDEDASEVAQDDPADADEDSAG